MAVKIQIKRGTKAGLPALSPGEYGLATDTGELFIGGANGNIQVATLGSDGKIPGGNLDLSGYVPTTRKINNKALSADISLTASDVGALPLSGGMMTGNLYAFDDSDPSNPKVRNSLLTDTELNDSILVQMPEGCIAWLYE